MRTALLAAAVLGLAACSPESPAPVTPDAAAPPPVPPAPRPPAPSRPPQVPARSSTLMLVDASGAPAIYLFCGARERALVVHAPALEPIGSEDRLTLGVGNEAFAFVADLGAPGPGVTATGVVGEDLFVRMARGEPVSTVYGRHTIGPTQAVTPAALEDFVRRCGGLRPR